MHVRWRVLAGWGRNNSCSLTELLCKRKKPRDLEEHMEYFGGEVGVRWGAR